MNESGQQLIGGILFDEMSGKAHLKWTKDGIVGFANIPGIVLRKLGIEIEASRLKCDNVLIYRHH